MKKLLIALSGVLFLSLGSCEKEENVKVAKNNEHSLKEDNLKVAKTNAQDLKEYFGNLRKTIKNDFVQLKKHHAIHNDWVTAGEKLFEGNELALESFRKNLNQSQADLALTAQSRSYSSGYQLNEVNKIINDAQKFHTFEEYYDFINEKFEYYLNDLTMSNDNKKFMLTFLVSYSESLDFLVKHVNFNDSAHGSHKGYSARSWWNNWFKCLTSIVGGLVTGSTTVGLLGATVGTVTMPVIGTISGAVVGVIGGGIGGALTGAVAAC